MSSEAIPGMALRIRETIKRRHGKSAAMIDRIDRLTMEQIYAQGPSDAIDALSRAKPSDATDFAQWEAYARTAQEAMDTKQINEWVRNVMSAYDLNPTKGDTR